MKLNIRFFFYNNHERRGVVWQFGNWLFVRVADLFIIFYSATVLSVRVFKCLGLYGPPNWLHNISPTRGFKILTFSFLTFPFLHWPVNEYDKNISYHKKAKTNDDKKWFFFSFPGRSSLHSLGGMDLDLRPNFRMDLAINFFFTKL